MKQISISIFSLLFLNFISIVAMEQTDNIAMGKTQETLVKKLKKFVDSHMDPSDCMDIDRMIEKRIDINVPDDDGATPLIIATSRWNFFCYIQPLLDAGADVNAQDRNGQTALISLDSLHNRMVAFNKKKLGCLTPGAFEMVAKEKAIILNYKKLTEIN